jgi:hypothetical protein
MSTSLPTLVKIGKKTKRISLQRYLLTKVLLEPGKVSEADLVCLYENQLWLESKSLKDINFFRKFSETVFTVSGILKECDLRSFKLKNLRRLATRLTEFCPETLVPERNYPQWKQRFSGRFVFNPQALDRELMEETKNNPPRPQRIKGYRDKGSKRDLAKDGSPSWQEIDASDPKEDWERRIDEARDIKDIEFVFCNLFPESRKSQDRRFHTTVSSEIEEETDREEATVQGS